MILSYIWTAFFLIGFIAALIQWLFLGDVEVFKRIIDGTFTSARIGVMDIALPLAGVMTLWLEIMNIGEKAGAIGWLGGISAGIATLVWYLSHCLTRAELETFSTLSSNLILLSIIAAFIIGALLKKVNVYDAFIEGAKGGIETALKIIPYLVGMLVAIGVLRNCGVLDLIVAGFNWVFTQFGINTDFTPALPTAIMKPLSSSGSRAMMVDVMKTYGVDSFVGRLACVFQGSADTTFYIVALYFGSVGIRKTRYAISMGLLADLAGVVAAIFVSYLFFGGAKGIG
jgi:spore maturation protein SpmB